MRAKIRCDEYSIHDVKEIMRLLAYYKIQVISTRSDWGNLYINIIVKDYSALCKFIELVNNSCYNPVIIVKTSKSKKCDNCEYYLECSNIRKLFSFLCVGNVNGGKKNGSL